MRILQVGKYYPPYKGGMETALRHICEGLLAQGHEVRAVVAGGGATTRRESLGGRPGRPGAGRRPGGPGTRSR